MADENTQAEVTSETVTDDYIAEQFPGQDPAHIRAMIDKMNGKEPAAEAAPAEAPAESEAVQYPDYIPEKFRQGSVEEAHAKLAQSYAELEKSRGKPAEAASEAPAEAPADEDVPPATLKSAQEEYLKDGEISTSTYEALSKLGLDRGVVDDFIAGQQAIANQLISKAHELVGGADAYADLMEWANNNWTDAEIDAYDRVMTQGDAASIKLAIAGLAAARGSEPRLRQGGDGDPSVAGYQSRAEMTADIRNPKYKVDPAFRKMVEQKIAVSKVW